MFVIRIPRANSLGDSIVWRELPEQKYQKCVYQHTDVVQTGQVGWMMLILQWKMVKLKGRQHFTHAQCEMSVRNFTHAQCKILSEKDGCSGLPEAAQGCPNL